MFRQRIESQDNQPSLQNLVPFIGTALDIVVNYPGATYTVEPTTNLSNQPVIRLCTFIGDRVILITTGPIQTYAETGYTSVDIDFAFADAYLQNPHDESIYWDDRPGNNNLAFARLLKEIVKAIVQSTDSLVTLAASTQKRGELYERQFESINTLDQYGNPRIIIFHSGLFLDEDLDDTQPNNSYSNF